MKIHFLGTAAAEGVPAVFCNCNTCTMARKTKGKDIRTRSQVLIDDDLMLDFPMDTYMHSLTHEIDLSRIESVFITHAHMDHCYPMEFTLHGEPYAHNMKSARLNIFANQTVIARLHQQHENEIKPLIKNSLTYTIIKSYESVTLKDKTVTALPAQHTVGEDCLIYLISKNGKNYLQFNDSGILSDEVYTFLAAKKIKLDAVSFDCTYGTMEKGKGRHMGLPDNINERHRMHSFCLVKPQTKYILTHFSHNCNLSYSQMQQIASENGFITAYDGMKIQL